MRVGFLKVAIPGPVLKDSSEFTLPECWRQRRRCEDPELVHMHGVWTSWGIERGERRDLGKLTRIQSVLLRG